MNIKNSHQQRKMGQRKIQHVFTSGERLAFVFIKSLIQAILDKTKK